MSQVAAESTARALQYGPTEGMAAAVECIVEVMAEEETTVDPAEVIVTTGGQQVIDLVCKALIDPGDVIVAEAPTYPGAVPTFGAYQAEVVQIEMDADGMPIDELESTLDRLAAQGRRPKFIYTIPNFQNPGGVTMSLPRRRRLVEVARERELLVLEDNPYGLLRYEGEPLPTLYSLDAEAVGRGGASDLVIYLGTFSKILSPGLRLGWAVAPRPVLEKLNLGKQGADLCSSPVTQLFVAAYFKDGDWREYLERLKELYRRRRDTMLEALEEHFGGKATLDEAAGRAVHLGDAERRRRHDRPARAQRGRGVRAGTRRLHGRTQRRLLDATELRRRPRRRHPRGRAADRQGHGRAGRPVWSPDGFAAQQACRATPRPTRPRSTRRLQRPLPGWPTSSSFRAEPSREPDGDQPASSEIDELGDGRSGGSADGRTGRARRRASNASPC